MNDSIKPKDFIAQCDAAVQGVQGTDGFLNRLLVQPAVTEWLNEAKALTQQAQQTQQAALRMHAAAQEWTRQGEQALAQAQEIIDNSQTMQLEAQNLQKNAKEWQEQGRKLEETAKAYQKQAKELYPQALARYRDAAQVNQTGADLTNRFESAATRPFRSLKSLGNKLKTSLGFKAEEEPATDQATKEAFSIPEVDAIDANGDQGVAATDDSSQDLTEQAAGAIGSGLQKMDEQINQSTEEHCQLYETVTDKKWQERQKTIGKAGDKLMDKFQGKNKALFTLGKTLASASIAMGTFSMAVEAFEAGTDIPFGPPALAMTLGVTAAGIVTAFGLGQISALQQQKFEERALGGSVASGTTYLVGELGPEILHMPSRGQMLTSRETKEALRQESKEPGLLIQELVIRAELPALSHLHSLQQLDSSDFDEALALALHSDTCRGQYRGLSVVV